MRKVIRGRGEKRNKVNLENWIVFHGLSGQEQWLFQEKFRQREIKSKTKYKQWFWKKNVFILVFQTLFCYFFSTDSNKVSDNRGRQRTFYGWLFFPVMWSRLLATSRHCVLLEKLTRVLAGEVHFTLRKDGKKLELLAHDMEFHSWITGLEILLWAFWMMCAKFALPLETWLQHVSENALCHQSRKWMEIRARSMNNSSYRPGDFDYLRWAKNAVIKEIWQTSS